MLVKMNGYTVSGVKSLLKKSLVRMMMMMTWEWHKYIGVSDYFIVLQNFRLYFHFRFFFFLNWWVALLFSIFSSFEMLVHPLKKASSSFLMTSMVILSLPAKESWIISLTYWRRYIMSLILEIPASIIALTKLTYRVSPQ